MERHVDLARLENIIEKLLTQFKELKHDKERLEDSLFQKDQEITSLKAEIADLHDDQSTVHKRVSDLIGSIEDWEKDNTVLTQMAIIPEIQKESGADFS